MFNREKGIYPSGNYVVGEDIPIGQYHCISNPDSFARVALYPDYAAYRGDKHISANLFNDDYHLSLREEGMVVELSNAYMEKLS